MTGPGKYDRLAKLVRDRVQADGIVLVIIGGNKGNGSSIQMPLEMVPAIASFLRAAADELEADARQASATGSGSGTR